MAKIFTVVQCHHFVEQIKVGEVTLTDGIPNY